MNHINNKDLILCQLKNIETYVKIVDTFDPIQDWYWTYNIKSVTIELHLLCENEIHMVTIQCLNSKKGE